MDFVPFSRCFSTSQNILQTEKKLKLSFTKLQTMSYPVRCQIETIPRSLGRFVARKMSWCTGAMVRLVLFTCLPKPISPGRMTSTYKLPRGVLNSLGRGDCCAKDPGYAMEWQVMFQLAFNQFSLTPLMVPFQITEWQVPCQQSVSSTQRQLTGNQLLAG